MDKQPPTSNPIYPNNTAPVPPPLAVGAATCTSSGVTVFDPTAMNTNQPLPPTYDQAMGNAAPFAATTTRTYTTTDNWRAPGYNMPTTHTTTTYTTYGTTAAATAAAAQPPPRRAQQQPTYVQPTPPPVVIIQQTPMLPLGPEPVYLTCPACHIQKLTRTEYEPSSRTHLMAALLCLVGLWCCVCLPYCAGSCMNTHHYCGNCDKFLGTFGNTL